MDDDIFAQFDPQPTGHISGGPKPPPEPKPNGRRKTKVAKPVPAKARGKRGRPKRLTAEESLATAVAAKGVVKLARASRNPRETKISLTAAADAFVGLTETDVAFVTAAIRNMSSMSAKQKKRIVHTLNRLFA